MSIKLVDFRDIQDAILEEMKIQSSDTVSLARIKRVINEVYINEVIPYARWKWLEGHTKLRFREAYSGGTASVSLNSTSIILSTAPAAQYGSFAGYFFSVTGHNEVYIISSHTAEATAITLSSEFLGTVDATASFKIWTDKVPLPVDCRETVTVWHNQNVRPMEAMGWQKFRELTIRAPKAEGYPAVYNTGDYKDPSTGTDEYESDRYREMRVHPAIYSTAVTISIDYIKEVVALSADGDEPVLPIEDRIVIKYGALATLWRTIGRNPEEAGFSMQEFQNKLQRMAGKVEDSHDKPQIHPDSQYMRRRRAGRYRIGGFSSDMAASGGGGNSSSTQFLQDVTIQGARLSANMTVDTGITIDGVDISVLEDDFAAHLVDTSDAHIASAITFVANGTIAATDVQTAISEVATDATTELSTHASDPAAHDASAIVVSPVGNLAADDVQEALEELQADIDTRITASSTDTLTNKSFNADGTGNSITNIENADIKAGAAIDASKIADGTVSSTEFQYINSLTSNAQTQIDGKTDKSTLTTKGDIYVATAASTIARQGIGSDGQILVADSAQTNGLKWSTIAGGTNYILNPGAEASTSGWATYADAAGTRPVDGTGGSPSSTWTRSTSSPLVGTGSFLCTKSAANRQGEGVSYDFTIDVSQKAKVMQIEFSYLVSSGTFVAGSTSADSDMIVYIYDVGGSVLSEPSSIKLLSNSSTIADKFVANFQTSATSTTYRLIVHTASTSASAYTLQFDDFKVAPCYYVYGTPITDWVSYTPTFTALGTVTGINFQSRKVGDSLQVRGRFTMGTGTASQAQMTLGYGGGNANVTIDSTKLSNIQLVGMAGYSPAFGRTMYMLGEPSTNYVTFSAQSAGVFAQLSGSSLASSSEIISVEFQVPITGWSSSTQVSDGFDGRLISVVASNPTSSVTSTASDITTWGTVTQDTTGSFNATTGVFTAPSSGTYDISGSFLIAATLSSTDRFALVYLAVNGSVVKAAQIRGAISNTNIGLQYSFDYPLRAGDTVKLQIECNGTSMSFNGGASWNILQIKKLQAPTTISATEKIVASIGLTSAVSPSANAVVLYDTKVEDSHNAFATGTGLFTSPAQGTYSFKVNALTGTTANFYIKVNGTAKGVFMTATAGVACSGSFDYPLNAGDTAGVYVDTGGTLTAVSGSVGFYNRFSIARLK